MYRKHTAVFQKAMTNQYIEEKKLELEQIITEGRWAEVDSLYKEMEDEGMGQYISELSQIMTDDDVREYKKWDLETNGTTADKMDDNA